MMMSVCPRLLYRSNWPAADSVIDVLFAATRLAFDGLSCDAVGRVPPAGYVVMKVCGAVAPTDVRLTSIAVTPLGSVQSPFMPNTSNVTVSAGPTGRRSGPFGSAGRVSTRRHGATGVTTDATSLIALTKPMPPEPNVTATAAPTAAHRLRLNLRRGESPGAVRATRRRRGVMKESSMTGSSATAQRDLRWA